jgi:hypothetical protein
VDGHAASGPFGRDAASAGEVRALDEVTRGVRPSQRCDREQPTARPEDGDEIVLGDLDLQNDSWGCFAG